MNRNPAVPLASWLVTVFAALILSGCNQAESNRPVRWYDQCGPCHVMRDLAYTGDGNDGDRCLDLVVPANQNGPLPLVVYIHGGAWVSGDKWFCPGAYLVRHGFAVASINYRLSRRASFPAQIEDCRAAVRFLREHSRQYGLDPARIGVWGNSAGGHLVAMLGTTSNIELFSVHEKPSSTSAHVQAVCDWCGPTDLVSIAGQCGPDCGLDVTSDDSPVYRLVGGKTGNWQERLRLASPINYVSPGDSPFLIMHGDLDNVVPLAQSDELYAALEKAGVEAQLVKVKNAGHAFGGAEEFAAVLSFFQAHLVNKTLGQK